MASALEAELDQLNIIIAAAEDWSQLYSKDPASHAKLIKLESKFERKLRKYFRLLTSERLASYINWVEYHTQVISAYDINVIFDDDNFDSAEAELLLNVVYDPVLEGFGVGLAAGQQIYERQLGLSSADAAIQKAALNHSAKLVKGVDQTTKERIAQAIQTSLRLGEDAVLARERVNGIINDPARAGTIARTEAVNSYSQGILSFGGESGATQKQWNDVGATDECADNSAQDPIDINDTFDSGDDAPPAHPNCRCGLELIYPSDQ